jgi:hypothetical protein
MDMDDVEEGYSEKAPARAIAYWSRAGLFDT